MQLFWAITGVNKLVLLRAIARPSSAEGTNQKGASHFTKIIEYCLDMAHILRLK